MKDSLTNPIHDFYLLTKSLGSSLGRLSVILRWLVDLTGPIDG